MSMNVNGRTPNLRVDVAPKTDPTENVTGGPQKANRPEGETLKGPVIIKTADGKTRTVGKIDDQYKYTIIINKDGSVEVKKEGAIHQGKRH